MGLNLEQKAEIEELQEDVTPEEVLDTMEKISNDADIGLDSATSSTE